MIDESGQGAAEYILLFAAVIIFAILALLFYHAYFQGPDISISEDLNSVRGNLSQRIN
ncbi:MAG: class III signal peptide-containing protein [Methanothermobacter sp.]|nr:class III signal peptide-containing protein [Methanothermobacter sp.]